MQNFNEKHPHVIDSNRSSSLQPNPSFKTDIATSMRMEAFGATALLAFRKQRLEYLLINLGCHETIKLVMP